ncbi:alkaline phosphatase D family protein [Sphingomonas endolithica]|uniref:alkaline phosphatase D family protein n=1 Tax=Sphingomonas endolithica TaxID=2972485 RepID=UPI0021AE68EF|nr:alkaline phosphatase D family protein [Sphingomonas sp. ZFBP2030]
MAAILGASAARAAIGPRTPFTLGIASGEPAADGFVLWTRLAPDPLTPGGGMPPHAVPVRWEVSEDEKFAKVRSGTVLAEPHWGHSVHVVVAGLRPNRPYWYRFLVGGEISPVGRTRTAPAAGTMVDRLRIVFASCQDYEVGYYAGHRHIVADAPDLVVFLGDYIYEGNASEPSLLRRHPTPEPVDLDGYRARYATYKSDPLLQATHQAAPWISTWDDHEVVDNYANDLDKHNGDPAVLLRRRAAAYQAFYEHTPLRPAQRPVGPAMQLYRTVDWGALAQFQVIDDRQYRAPPPCQPDGSIERRLDAVWLTPDCAERHDPRRSLLGTTQEQWLAKRLRATRARWNLLAQQTLMMPYTRIDPATPNAPPSVYNSDSWEGYAGTREWLLRQWRDARTPNPLVLSGDIHAFVAGDHVDPDYPERIIASEFVGGSMTSGNHDATLRQATAIDPNFRFAENRVRGYARADLFPDRSEVAFRGVSNVRDPNATVSDLARFTIDQGRPGIRLG